jgi:hypothetical protein
MRVLDLSSLLPPAGSNNITWLARFQVKAPGDDGEESYRIFYAGAVSVAGGNPSFFSGTGISASDLNLPGDGCISSLFIQATPQARNCKLILYPQEKHETGTFDRENGIINVKVPLADIGNPKVGDTLFSVAGLSFGQTNGNPVYKDVDATRAFDYVITTGQNNQCDVEGGGEFNNGNGGTGRSDFAMNEPCGEDGKIEFEDHGSGETFHSQDPTIAIQGNTATITGVGFTGLTLTTFTVIVQDNGGLSPDTFTIILGTGYSASGVLTSGRIHII